MMKLLDKIWPWSRFAADADEIGVKDAQLRFLTELLEEAAKSTIKRIAKIDKLERQCEKPSEASRKGWSTRRAKALMAAKDIQFQPLRPREDVVAGVVANRKIAKALS